MLKFAQGGRFMNWKDLMNDENRQKCAVYAITGCIIVLFYVLLTHLGLIGHGISSLVRTLMPFLIGFCLAFLAVPFRRLVEYRWLKNTKWSPKAKRGVAVAASLILVVLLIAAFFSILIPQLISSIGTFVNNFSSYVDNLHDFVNSLPSAADENSQFNTDVNNLIETVASTAKEWLTGASGGMQKIMNAGMNFVTGIVNFFIGLIIMVYLLYDEERFKRTFKKINYSLLPRKAADSFIYVLCLCRDAFNNFIFGKIIDSLIIGILCYICVAFLKIPYPVLIAVIVGITNIIPVFGPFIGAIPCLIILVMIDPLAALKFLIFIIILQQVDGNIIGPKILGGSMGLPTLWIMFAIIVGGSLFGVFGMVIGVPLFSVIYTLIRRQISQKLKEKDIHIS